MISITRLQARHLRAVLRRHALGLPRVGAAPPVVLTARGPAGGIRARLRAGELAVEASVPGLGAAGEELALPLEALAVLEGRDETPVVLRRDVDGRTAARWADRGIRQARTCTVPAPERRPACGRRGA